MSLLEKVQKRSVECKFCGTHPILRMGLDRNVIDAYFTGLVFAVVADDEAVDEAERAKLEKIGLALNLSPDHVRGAVDEMLARDVDAKVAVAEEAAGVLRGTAVVRLFLCEWSQIWLSHDYYKDNLNEYRQKLCEWLDYEYNEKLFEKFDHGNGWDCVALKSMFCDDQAEYLSRAWRLRRQPRPAHSCVTSSIVDPGRTK